MLPQEKIEVMVICISLLVLLIIVQYNEPSITGQAVFNPNPCELTQTIDIGNTSSETQIEGFSNIKYNLSGVPDARMVWFKADDKDANITINTTNKELCQLRIKVLDDESEKNNKKANDDFEIYVNGEMIYWYTNTNQTTGDTWIMHTINTANLSNISKITIKVPNYTQKRNNFNKYGQVAVDTIEIYARMSCTEIWTCTEWDECANNIQNRICTDSNVCGTESYKPNLTQYCCVENWSCTDWSSCTNFNQTRTCSDNNNCGTTELQPTLTQPCCTENWGCSEWSNCTGFSQSRTCTDSNVCGTESYKPNLTQYCCVENWSCTDWSSCNNNIQNRTCADTNQCSTETSKPELTQNCTISEAATPASSASMGPPHRTIEESEVTTNTETPGKTAENKPEIKETIPTQEEKREGATAKSPESKQNPFNTFTGYATVVIESAKKPYIWGPFLMLFGATLIALYTIKRKPRPIIKKPDAGQ